MREDVGEVERLRSEFDGVTRASGIKRVCYARLNINKITGGDSHGNFLSRGEVCEGQFNVAANEVEVLLAQLVKMISAIMPRRISR